MFATCSSLFFSSTVLSYKILLFAFNRYWPVMNFFCYNIKEDISRCFELADKALYLAKKSGRNCIKYIQT